MDVLLLPARPIQRYTQKVISTEARFFPIIAVSFQGPYTRPIIDSYFEEQTSLARRALREGVFLISVAKSPDAPDAQARRWIAEATRAMPAELRARTVRSFCIVDGAVQRGVVTAMSWLFKEMADLEPVASEDEAFVAIQKLLARRGEALPVGLSAASLRRAFRSARSSDMVGGEP